MNKPLSLSIIAFSVASSFTAVANTITGEVKDESGLVLTQGFVQIMGTNKRTPINVLGQFEFTGVKPGKVELHVSSVNHIHSSEKILVVADKVAMVNITVDTSSIEIFDVNASAFHASNIESAAPVSVLAGEKLRQQQASTLGETLKNLAGVHSTYYGGVTSSPIIRGLDGPRVLITQNGMDAADASRVGPDHLVATESSTVEQIEVLRGPATLFYGSGAIGGVVNMVDTRIPDNNLREGQVTISRNSNNGEQAFSGEYKTGFDNIAFQVLGFYRDSNDYRIPGFAESEEAHDEHDGEEHDDHDGEEHDDHSDDEEGAFGVVENTAARTQGITLGSSYLFDTGHVGFSMEHLSSVYGIPGHAHGEHEDEHGDEHDDHDGEHMEIEGEEIVQADLQQNRYQLAGEFQLSTPMVSAINFGIAYTDYQHIEIENMVAGTRFSNELFETRIEILHQPLSGWRGGISLHTKMSDFSAVGEEAFTPPSDTKSFGLGLIEEKHFGDVLVQLGARIEKVTIDVPRVFAPELALHDSEHSAHDEDHDEEHSEEHHDDGHSDNSSLLMPVSLGFTPISVSAGVVWDVAKGYNLAASFVHAKRAPSSAELFAFGPHIGTQTYEVGALYELHEEGFEFESNTPNMETSNNIDLSFRKFGGSFGAVFNLFYNQVDDFYYAADTGFMAEIEHADEDEHSEDESHDAHEDELGHEDEHEEGHEEEGLPVFAYIAADADLYGAEIQLTYNVTNNLTLMAQGDYIRAKVKQSETGNLPRIPPIKTILSVDYKTNDFSVMAQATHMFAQTDIADLETKTDAYTLVDINASYFTNILDMETEVFLRGRNLFDEEARVHTSFLKNLAPMQGRSVELGIRLNF
jgi:iron complex outermembrane receptor protein